MLNNGLEMPVIGLGTFPMKRLELFFAVYYALSSGYRMFDTASAYSNEYWLGLALSIYESLGLANDVFITTKLSNTEQRTMSVEAAFFNSIKRLRRNKIDLYLMHWPYPENYIESWKQMERLYEAGHVKAIGVCNFHVHHLEELLKVAKIKPVVNQIELHPLLTQVSLRKFCGEHNICVEAYSPVARMNKKLVEHDALIRIAQRHTKSVPQIILRWNIQSGFITIPKSSSKRRIKENISVFDFILSEAEMVEIDSINQDYRVRYDPDNADLTRL